MIREFSNIWTNQDKTTMTQFRDRFFTTYPDCENLSSWDILFKLLEEFDISWDNNGNLPADILSQHVCRDNFSFAQAGENKYLIITDHKLAERQDLLLSCLFHELAHIFFEHTPSQMQFAIDDSPLSVMQRITQGTLQHVCSAGNEREADLLTATLLFHPLNDFVENLWKDPLNARRLSEKFEAPFELVVKMMIAHSYQQVHFFCVDASSKKFKYSHIPYQDSHRMYLNETRLLNEETALSIALKNRRDASFDSGDDNYHFHCEAFFLNHFSKEHVVVLGSKKSDYIQWSRLGRMV